MTNFRKLTLYIFIALHATLINVYAVVPTEKLIVVNVMPNHENWCYKLGEKLSFSVNVLKSNIPLKDVEIRYELSQDMMPPFKVEMVHCNEGVATIDAGMMKKAGFLRCRVFVKYKDVEYEGLATAAFEPEKIQPTTTLPKDFIEFWNNAKSELAKIPLDVKMTLVPERCTEKTNTYHVSIQNYQIGTRLYGMLCVPKASGKYPAVLCVPGAGVRSYSGDLKHAEKGIITFEIGVHGIPVNMPTEVYTDLYAGALKNYRFYNLDNKNQYYYKRVYMGCVRAIDYIFSLPQFDSSNLVVVGGSQGGGLAIITAALDSRVKGLVSFYPALCDLTGYLHGRAGGWPHLFKNREDCIPEKIETSRYYDAVNFAKQINVPGFYSFGFNDTVCPPTSVYSALNEINAPKDILIIEKTGHYSFPEQWDEAWTWIYNMLNLK